MTNVTSYLNGGGYLYKRYQLVENNSGASGSSSISGSSASSGISGSSNILGTSGSSGISGSSSVSGSSGSYNVSGSSGSFGSSGVSGYTFVSTASGSSYVSGSSGASGSSNSANVSGSSSILNPSYASGASAYSALDALANQNLTYVINNSTQKGINNSLVTANNAKTADNRIKNINEIDYEYLTQYNGIQITKNPGKDIQGIGIKKPDGNIGKINKDDIIKPTDKPNVGTTDTVINTKPSVITPTDSTEVTGEVVTDGIYSDEEIDAIVSMLSESEIEVTKEDVKQMITDLTTMAKSKGVNPTEYVTARLVEFLTMKSDDPRSLTLEQMNEKMALNKTMELSLYSLVPSISELFSTEITSYEDLFTMQSWEVLLTDEYPQAREAYIQTSRMTYLSLVQYGDFTNKEYLDSLRNDLLNVFPLLNSYDDNVIEDIETQIQSLSPSEIEDLLNDLLALPGCYQDGFDDALEDFMDKFNNLTQNRSEYLISNPNETISMKDLFKQISGTEFNPDSIIEMSKTLNNVESVINASSVYKAAENIFNKVDRDELDLGDALWQLAYVYSSFGDEEAMLNILKEMTGNDDIYIDTENATVIIPQTASARGARRAQGANGQYVYTSTDVIESAKGWCKSIFKGAADLLISQSVQQQYKDADFSSVDGVLNFTGDLLSNPDFYKDMGKIALTGAGIAATGGTGLGVMLATATGTAAYAAGTYGSYEQAIRRDGGATYENTIEFASNILEGGLDYLGVKYANASFVLPACVQGTVNKVTGKVSSVVSDFMNNVGWASQVEDGTQEVIAEVMAALEKAGVTSEKHLQALQQLVDETTVVLQDGNKELAVTLSDEARIILQDAINDVKSGNMGEDVIKALYMRKGEVDWGIVTRAVDRGYTDADINYLVDCKLKDFGQFGKPVSENRAKDILRSWGIYDYQGSAVDRLRQTIFDNIKKNMDCVKAMRVYAANNTNSVAMNLVRIENGSTVLKGMKVEGKSMDEWLRECKQTGDYNKLIEALNKGNTSYTYDYMAGASLNPLYNGDGLAAKPLWKWNITAEAGAAHGILADVAHSSKLWKNGYMAELEWLMAKGTTLKVTGARMGTDGLLILDAIIEGKQVSLKILENGTILIAPGLGMFDNLRSISDDKDSTFNYEEFNYLMNQINDFIANNANDPSSQKLINYMNDWIENSDDLSWDNMITYFSILNPDQVIRNKDGSVTWNGQHYDSLEDWHEQTGKFAAKTDENGTIVFATDGSWVADGEGGIKYVDLTQLPEVIVKGHALDAPYTDSQGRHWNTLRDCIAAHKENYTGSPEDYYKCHTENGYDITLDPNADTDEVERWLAILAMDNSSDLASVNGGGGSSIVSNDPNNFCGYEVDGNALDLYEEAVAKIENGECSSLEQACQAVAKEHKFDLGTGSKLIDNKLRNGAYINPDGTFDIEQFTADMIAEGVKDLGIQYICNSDPEDGTQQYEIIITTPGLGEAIIGVNINRITGLIQIEDDRYVYQPTLEELQLEFIEGLKMFTNGYDYQINQFALNQRMQKICDIITEEMLQKYRNNFIEDHMTGYTSSKELLNLLAPYGYAGNSVTYSTGENVHTDVYITQNAIYGYAAELMNRDAEQGYNSFQQLLRMQDRICALENIAKHSNEWSQERLEYETQRIMSDECTGEYAWLNTDTTQYQNWNTSTNGLWDVSGTSSAEPYVQNTPSQKEFLHNVQARMAEQLARKLKGSPYNLADCLIRTEEYTGRPYIMVIDANGYSFAVHLDQDDRNRTAEEAQFLDYIRTYRDSANDSTTYADIPYNIFSDLESITSLIAKKQADIKRAELAYYEQMTLYTMGVINEETLDAAKDSYLDLVREYQSNTEEYSCFIYSNGALEIPSNSTWNSREFWERYDRWYDLYYNLF